MPVIWSVVMQVEWNRQADKQLVKQMDCKADNQLDGADMGSPARKNGEETLGRQYRPAGELAVRHADSQATPTAACT